jgi:hypothetical protein
MMRLSSLVAATLLAVLTAGCASHEGPTGGTDPRDASTHVMSEHVTLSDLVGRWSGANKLWFMPGEPVRESDATASVSLTAGGAFAVIAYTWSYEGDAQDGTLMLRAAPDADDVQVVWVDSWHTGGKFMQFQPEDGRDGLVAVRGSYKAPPGPDWGWRVVLEADGADAFRILMDNITPEGEEAPAVAASFTREADAVRSR